MAGVEKESSRTESESVVYSVAAFVFCTTDGDAACASVEVTYVTYVRRVRRVSVCGVCVTCVTST